MREDETGKIADGRRPPSVGSRDDVVRIEVRPVRRRPSLRRPLAWALPIAALLVMYHYWPTRIEYEVGERASVREERPRGESGLKPRGELPLPPARFEWPAVRGAANYRFRLHDGDAALLYEAVTPDTLLLLGDTAPLFGERRYGAWQVIPIAPTGREMAAYPAQHFQILGEP